jgi:6-phosphogluconate dehydrogenase
MEIGIVGLGRMGANIALRLMKAGHKTVVYDTNAEISIEGAVKASSLKDMCEILHAPRAIWVMLPHGEITENTLQELSQHCASGDTLIDGGNSFWKEDIRRGHEFAKRGIDYLDIGTSGGVWGLERGYCLMIGGAKAAVDRLDPIFKALAPGMGDIELTPHREGRDARPSLGYLHAGGCGAGHFVKMVHNGIEYGMMQAFAEGFDIMKHANSPALPPEHRLELDLPDIAEVWRRGSVVTSWLLDLTASALAEEPGLTSYSGVVSDSGEGRWTVQAAIEEAVPAEVLTAALYTRFRSRQEHTFAEKILSAMRKGFGGHVEKK